MRTKGVLLTFMIIFIIASGFAQQTTRRARRERDKIVKEHQIDSLIHSKAFVFIATRALPQGGGSIDMTSNSNSLKFSPDKITSYMPYFGRAYSIDYGGDAGIKFEGKPKEFNIAAHKSGKGYEIKVRVEVTRDTYQLMLIVNPAGDATLTINCNQRSTISYFGDIFKFDEQEDKKH